MPDVVYLTADLPGVGGRIKADDADFRVVEIPLYTPCGHGEHTYVRIVKTGIPTFEAVRRMARALGIDSRTVGYAGLKDAHAIAEQTLSLGNVPIANVERLDVPGVRVLSVDRHTNKLRMGHLRGNRFTIRVVDAVENPGPRASAILDVLTRQGVPNYYGEQRFGLRGDTHLLGRAIVRQDPEAFVGFLLGVSPSETDGSSRDTPRVSESPRVREARRQYEAGHLEASLQAWPRHMEAERRAVQVLIDRPGDYGRALRSIPSRMRRFYVSAYQSALFNRLLARRLRDDLGRLLRGDLAYIHGKGAVFTVEDPAAEQARADRLEISPSGPLYGYKLTMAQGLPGEMEQQILAQEGLTLEDWRLRGLKLKGARRALRFPLQDAAATVDDQGLVVSFGLPPGSYATVVMREVIK